MAEPTAPRRPPPLPANLPRRTTPPPAPPAPARTAAAPPAMPPVPARPSSAPREWVPPPAPRLLQNRPPPPEAFGNLLEPDPQSTLDPRMAWIALMGWGFVVVMLLLVLMPTEAIAKLTTPSRQPVSAAAYGPLMAVFAIVAVIVTVSGLLWMWLAMSRPYDPPPDGG